MKRHKDISEGLFWLRRIRMALTRQYFINRQWSDDAHRDAYYILVQIDMEIEEA